MKLHMQSPHESGMDPMDFGVKKSKVKVTIQIETSTKMYTPFLIGLN